MVNAVAQAVAVVIRSPKDRSRFLVVRRPDTDEELPGIWGLPATSLRPGETEHDALRRLGRTKLGADLNPGPCLAQGEQARGDRTLQMRLYEVTIDRPQPSLPEPPADASAGTYYTGWRWSEPSILEEGASRGSLCCRLFLDFVRAESP